MTLENHSNNYTSPFVPYIPYIQFIAHNHTNPYTWYIIHKKKKQTMQNVKQQTRNKGKTNKYYKVQRPPFEILKVYNRAQAPQKQATRSTIVLFLS